MALLIWTRGTDSISIGPDTKGPDWGQWTATGTKGCLGVTEGPVVVSRGRREEETREREAEEGRERMWATRGCKIGKPTTTTTTNDGQDDVRGRNFPSPKRVWGE